MSAFIRSIACLLVAALLLSACTGSSPTAPASAGAAGEPQAGVLVGGECDTIRIERAQGAPFGAIAVDGWKPALEDGVFLLARYTATGAEPVVVVVSDHTEQVWLPIPVHPGDPAGGGDTTVAFGILDDPDDEDRADWCDDTFEVAIDGLPTEATSGTVAAELARTVEVLDAALEPWGTTAEELRSLSPHQVEAELAPAYVVASLALDPDGLPGLLAELDADEQDLADRLAAQLTGQHEPRTELVRRPDVDVQAAAAMPNTAVTLASLQQGAPAPGDASRALPVQSGGTEAGDGACIDTTLPDLAALVGYQLSGSAMISGAPGFALDTAMLLAGVPYLGRVGLPTVLLSWMTKTAAAMLEGTMPSEMAGASVSSSPGVLWEDDVDGGLVEEVSLTFASTGWDSGPALVELATILADQSLSRMVKARLDRAFRRSLGDRFADTAARFGGLEINSALEMLELAVLEDQVVAAQTELIAELTSWIVTTFVAELVSGQGWAEGRSVLSTEPRCWRAESRAPELDPMVEISYLVAIEEGFIAEQFLAREIGTGLINLHVELPVGQHLLGPVGPEARGTTARFTNRHNVEVLPIQLVWDPSREVVAPGDVVALNLQIRNAHDGRVRVTDSLGTLDRELTPTDGSIIFYTVPDDWDEASPILVTATSLSADGLRRPNHPGYRGELSRSARLVPEGAPELTITPPSPCVEPGDTVELRAVDAGDRQSDIEVAWATSAGSISAAGVLTTPGQPGEVEVTATAVADETVIATTVVQVGTCEICTFELEVDGLLGPVSSVRYDHTDPPSTGSPFPPVPSIGLVDWETGEISSVGVPGLLAFPPDTAGSTGVVVSLVGDERFRRWDQHRGRFEHYDAPSRGNVLAGLYDGIPVAGWRNPEATMTLEVERREIAAYRSTAIEIPAYPVLHVRGTVSGPVVVGRRMTGWEGPFPAMTSAYEGEPIVGQVTVRFEGLFQPYSEDWPHPDFDGPGGGWEDRESGGPPPMLRTFDLETGNYCTPVHMGLDSRGDGQPAPWGDYGGTRPDGAPPAGGEGAPTLPQLPSAPGS